PVSEAAILLAIANYLIQNGLYDREFVRRWWNWEEYLEQRSEVGDQRSEDKRDVSVSGQEPRSGEIFIETELTNERDSKGLAESINMTRIRRDEESDKHHLLE